MFSYIFGIKGHIKTETLFFLYLINGHGLQPKTYFSRLFLYLSIWLKPLTYYYWIPLYLKAKLKIRTHPALVTVCCYYSNFRFSFSLSPNMVYYFLLTFQLYQYPKAVRREVIILGLERNKITL